MKFTAEELNFIRKELKIQAKEEETREEVLAQIWEEACSIEVEESNHLAELTSKGRMAVHLVTKLGDD